MVITVEPGLYFKSDDELVPDELRGIGVRIEDDIVITANGNENLSAALPRQQHRGRGLDGLDLGRIRASRAARVSHDDDAAASVPADDQVGHPATTGAGPSALPSPPSSVIAWAWYVNGVRKPAESMTVAARLACAGEGFVWLGLKDPKDADLMALSSQFDLHPLAIEDAVHGHTRSKLEMFGDDLFMVISTVAYVDHEELTETSEVVATGQVMVFLGDHFVITVRRGEHAQLSALRRSLEADPERLARGPSEVLYAIADKIIDDYLAGGRRVREGRRRGRDQRVLPGGPARGRAGLPAQAGTDRVQAVGDAARRARCCGWPPGNCRWCRPRPRRTSANWPIITPRPARRWRPSTRC